MHSLNRSSGVFPIGMFLSSGSVRPFVLLGQALVILLGHLMSGIHASMRSCILPSIQANCCL